jgi:hypothetical protein
MKRLTSKKHALQIFNRIECTANMTISHYHLLSHYIKLKSSMVKWHLQITLYNMYLVVKIRDIIVSIRSETAL